LNPQQECIAYKELAVTPFVAYVDDEVADKMDEYGYSGLSMRMTRMTKSMRIDMPLVQKMGRI
jgi:hypothetical protein